MCTPPRYEGETNYATALYESLKGVVSLTCVFEGLDADEPDQKGSYGRIPVRDRCQSVFFKNKSVR